MYYAVYPDGTLSEDFYNKTWAKEHSARLEEAHRALILKGLPEPIRSSLVSYFYKQVGTLPPIFKRISELPIRKWLKW